MKYMLCCISLAVLSALSNASSYTLDIYVESFEEGPSSIIGTASFCMANHVGPTNFVENYIRLELETLSELFSYCGVRHSSETLVIRDANKKDLVTFEFYKPVGVSKEPHIIEISSVPYIKCTYFSGDILQVNCEKHDPLNEHDAIDLLLVD